MAGDPNWEAEWLRWKALASVVAVPSGFGAVVAAALVGGTYLKSSEAAAWAQAIGSLIGIAIAVAVPLKVHRYERAAAREKEIRDDVESRRLIYAALRADIDSTVERLNRSEEVMVLTSARIREKRQLGAEMQNTTPYVGMSRVSDFVIYRAVASKIAQLPDALVAQIIGFYGNCGTIEVLGDGATSIESACEIIVPLLPRLRMEAEMIKMKIDLFMHGAFRMDAPLNPTVESILAAADRVHYPIRQIAADNGREIREVASRSTL